VAPTLVYYASTDPQALWRAGAATALFVAALGAAGYATGRTVPLGRFVLRDAGCRGCRPVSSGQKAGPGR
jgi:hypothetical protein